MSADIHLDRLRDVMGAHRKISERYYGQRPNCVVCGRGTAEGKPACIDHLAEVLPYYAKVVADEKRRAAEKERRKRKPRKTDRLVQDAREFLEHNAPTTVAHLALVLDVDADYAAEIAALLNRQRHFRFVPGERGIGWLEHPSAGEGARSA